MQVPPEVPVTHETIGPSGTGKTTLLTCNLVKPTSGTIAFDDIRMDFGFSAAIKYRLLGSSWGHADYELKRSQLAVGRGERGSLGPSKVNVSGQGLVIVRINS